MSDNDSGLLVKSPMAFAADRVLAPVRETSWVEFFNATRHKVVVGRIEIGDGQVIPIERKVGSNDFIDLDLEGENCLFASARVYFTVDGQEHDVEIGDLSARDLRWLSVGIIPFSEGWTSAWYCNVW